MYEIFGFSPLLKITGIVIILVFFSAYLGILFTENRIQNKVLQLAVGLIVVMGAVAIINANGLTIFTPALLCLFLVFKPNFREQRKKLEEAAKLTAQFLLFFLSFLFLEIIRQSYFSVDFINSSWADYSFYLTTADNILAYDIETPHSFLSDYGYKPKAGIYHYFDLYLLFPIFLAKLPPLLGYLFFYLPLCYTLGALSISSLFKLKLNLITIITGVLAINAVGLSILNLDVQTTLNITSYHKACYFLISLLIFNERGNLKIPELFLLMVSVTITLSPIIFCVATFSLIISYLLKAISPKINLLVFFDKRLIIGAFVFIIFFYFSYFSGSDHSYMIETMDESENRDFIMTAVLRLKALLSTFQFLPVFILFLAVIILKYVQTKKIASEVMFLLIALFTGTMITTLYFDHYDSDQFFNIVLISILPYSIFYLIYEPNLSLKENRAKWLKVGAVLFLAAPFLFGGQRVFSHPRALDKVSVEFIDEIQRSGKRDNLNALYFKEIKSDNHWLNYVPYMPFSTGYINLFNGSNCIQPIPLSFFDTETHPANAQNIIAASPFDRYRIDHNSHVSSYYENNYAELINSFIEENKINTLIFDREMIIPEWVNRFENRIVINPKRDYDKHILIIINVN